MRRFVSLGSSLSVLLGQDRVIVVRIVSDLDNACIRVFSAISRAVSSVLAEVCCLVIELSTVSTCLTLGVRRF